MKLALLGLCTLAVGAAFVPSGGPRVIGAATSPLEGRTKNQRINAVRATEALDGVVIAPGETLSFNRLVGSWSRDRGFVKAPVSYNGHLISAYGGAVCQASTTLYNAALEAGLEIVARERHRFAPTYVAPGRDAAVAFPDIDLRLRNPYDRPVVIRAGKDRESLIVKIEAELPDPGVQIVEEIHSVAEQRDVVARPGREVHPHRGKAGFEVSIYRLWPDGTREHVSTDTYPHMDRLLARPTP